MGEALKQVFCCCSCRKSLHTSITGQIFNHFMQLYIVFEDLRISFSLISHSHLFLILHLVAVTRGGLTISVICSKSIVQSRFFCISRWPKCVAFSRAHCVDDRIINIRNVLNTYQYCMLFYILLFFCYFFK